MGSANPADPHHPESAGPPEFTRPAFINQIRTPESQAPTTRTHNKRIAKNA
jgi:hypothetical protein